MRIPLLALTLPSLLAGCAAANSQRNVATAAVPSTSTEPVAAQYSAADVKAISAEEVRQGYLKHAALTQYYRWFLVYENDNAVLDNAIDILDENVRVKSALGEAKGHAAYRERVAKLPKFWENAHQVNNVVTTINPDGTINLVGNITYLNKGALPDGAVRQGELTYITKLKPAKNLLPQFYDVEVIANSESRAPAVVPEYANNRLLSLVHYWMALNETPNRDSEPFREILAEGFAINFSTGTLDSFDKFKAWYAGPASVLAANTHIINDYKVTETGPNSYRLSADFDWHGIARDGTILVGRGLYDWTIIDNPVDRFPKIKTLSVKFLVPFQPKPK